MLIHDIITTKRDGGALSSSQIEFFIKGLVGGSFGEEQVAALLMAIYIHGMQEQELVNFTLGMANSGEMLDLSSLPGIPVDKHSTGGVGDKLTLVVAPLAAAAGVTVAKMSGRGLGHTGGTIDKLEAIPGLVTELSEEAFLEQVRQIKVAIISQSASLVPADKILYDLRNRTATVSSIPLIASSIMSKKLAAGCGKILLDVTVGQGAFMKDLPSAIALAEAMVAIGNGAGRETVAILTNMDEPLGYTIGNGLEVKEAMQTLAGSGPEELEELALLFVSEMMQLAGLGEASSHLSYLRQLLLDGTALQFFRRMVEAQGGDATAVFDHTSTFALAKVTQPYLAPQSGYVSKINALLLGEAAVLLGAGRLNKGDTLDMAAGIRLECGRGKFTQIGEPLCQLHAASDALIARAMPLVAQAFTFAAEPPKRPQQVLGRII
ncbi:MAG: thymidine phosphorylase [Symbiobacteriaceae bacterium]|nr:thymidine phosphorylase [Symbiobacteriaceae bacterium]